MIYLTNNWQSYLKEVAAGNISGASLINKFGRNLAVGTAALEPITVSGTYKTPTALTSLEIVSDDTADTNSGGAGARTVEIYGIGTSYALVSETVNMNGTTAVALANQYYRVFRMRVATSGAYASDVAASQVGTITLRVASAGATWAVIDEAVAGFGVGQTQIGCYTVPAGYTAYLLYYSVSVDSNKSANVYFFTREGIDTVSAPYTGMNVKIQHLAQSGHFEHTAPAPLLVIPEKTDCGFMGLGSGAAADVSVDFQLLLEQN